MNAVADVAFPTSVELVASVEKQGERPVRAMSLNYYI